jgi:hypothetical protein
MTGSIASFMPTWKWNCQLTNDDGLLSCSKPRWIVEFKPHLALTQARDATLETL